MDASREPLLNAVEPWRQRVAMDQIEGESVSDLVFTRHVVLVDGNAISVPVVYFTTTLLTGNHTQTAAVAFWASALCFPRQNQNDAVSVGRLSRAIKTVITYQLRCETDVSHFRETRNNLRLDEDNGEIDEQINVTSFFSIVRFPSGSLGVRVTPRRPE